MDSPAHPVFALVLTVLAAWGCATPSGRVPPGDELELEESPAPLGQPAPPADEQALAQAFDVPSMTEAASAEEESSNLTPPGLPASPQTEKAPEDTEAESLLEEAQARLRDGAPAELLKILHAEFRSKRPELQQRRLELLTQAAERLKDGPAQARYAEAWLLSCGPLRPDACRARALRALSLATPRSTQPPKVGDADTCLRKLETARGTAGQVSLPPCLPAAVTVYRRMKDRLMEARVALAKARVLQRERGKAGQAFALLNAAERACDAPRCSDVRRRALRELARLSAQENRPEDAARAALREMELLQRSLPPERRPYARTPEVDKRCTALDARQGAGSCRKLERSLLGSYTFFDFSQASPKEELTAEQVKDVNAHFLVTLEDCWSAQATKLRPPTRASYDVQWSIRHDGRVEKVRLGRPDERGSPLERCLETRFELWRYPPYRGEQQHVEQRFVVQATERR